MTEETDKLIKEGRPLPLRLIAAWHHKNMPYELGTEIIGQNHNNEEYGRVLLPVIQRGAVWRPPQVELLWDSLLRGFPVGILLFSEFMGDEITKESDRSRAQYLLLDGQQRTSAIALGFQNLLGPEDMEAVLWIDLLGPDNDGDDPRKYILRLITTSHPWGYVRTYAEETKKISAKKIREAIAAYEVADKGKSSAEHVHTKTSPSEWRAGKISPKRAWPWDAKAPVPLSLLLEVAFLGDGSVTANPEQYWAAVKDRFEKLSPVIGVSRVLSEGNEHANKFTGLTKALSLMDGEETVHMKELREAVAFLREHPGLPSSMLKLDTVDDNNNHDAIEQFFIRINRQGTPLQGEELIYSIVKSKWSGAYKLVEDIRKDHKLAEPSRLVFLCSRLAMSRSSPSKPPPELTVARFRRALAGQEGHKDYSGELQRMLEKGNFAELIKQAVSILRYKENEPSDLGLNRPGNRGGHLV